MNRKMYRVEYFDEIDRKYFETLCIANSKKDVYEYFNKRNYIKIYYTQIKFIKPIDVQDFCINLGINY